MIPYRNIYSKPVLLWTTLHQLKRVTYYKGTLSPAGNYMFKVNKRNTRKMHEICSKLTVKTPERISHHVLAFLLLTLIKQMPTGYRPQSGSIAVYWELGWRKRILKPIPMFIQKHTVIKIGNGYGIQIYLKCISA